MEKIDLSFNASDFEFEFNQEDFTIDFSTDAEFETGLIKPRLRPEIKQEHLKFQNAEKLAKNIGITENFRVFAIVDGTFIFGDFIEAFIVQNKLFIKELTISTLSMSQENIDSLVNLLEWKCVKKLSLIVSAYFFAHERRNLVKIMYEEMKPFGERFQLAVASSHTKIT